MKKIILIVIALAVIGGAIYYYEVRPSMIRNECHWEGREKATKAGKDRSGVKEGWYLKSDYDHYYKHCLRNKGIKL